MSCTLPASSSESFCLCCSSICDYMEGYSNLLREYAESKRLRLWPKPKTEEVTAGQRVRKRKALGWEWKKEQMRDRPFIGFELVLKCLLVLRDQPILTLQEVCGLSQHTQTALLAEAMWHGCGCCCQSVTGSSDSFFSHPFISSHTFPQSHTICITLHVRK